MNIDTKQPIVALLKRLAPRRRPEVLYHYTSLHGLMSIVGTKSIWATSIKFLNDSKEFSLAMNIAHQVVANRKEYARSRFELGVYEVLLDSLDRASHDEVFVTSFSEHGDQLGQWRGYTPSGSGYAIGFMASGLGALKGGVPVRFLARCIYDEKDHQSLVESAVENVVHQVRQFDATTSSKLDRAYREAFKLFSTLLPILAPVLKHSAFKEEAEWRLISLLNSFDNAHPEYRPGNSTLVPFFEYPLSTAEERIPLHEIVVGPTPHPDLARQAVEGLLRKYRVRDARVRNSDIPFRNW